MDSNYPSIVLKAGKERSLLARHPWVFSGAILKQPKGLEEGTIVKVYQNDGSYLATGQFHKNTITVRCIDFENSEINQLFWNDKIAKAYNMRTALNYIGQSHSNSYRIIHGEGDGLPGLVIDIYNQIAIVQCYTKGMYDVLDSISNAIKNVYGKSLLAIYNKSSETLAKHGVTDTKDGYLWRDEGYSESTIALENEIQYKIDYVNGQKTGFFLDQRENRALLKYYSKGKKYLIHLVIQVGFH